MLSICIPVFNCFVYRLVGNLNNHVKQLKLDFEIIIIDDFSDESYKLRNKDLSELESVRYIELEKNIGRSAIRNLFLKYAGFDYLLFLDCDSQITNNQFITKYIDNCSNSTTVICGGTVYIGNSTKNKNNFRLKYGLSRECVPCEIRKLNPYLNFKTNNFLIRKTVLDEIKFDERLTDYGHEDSLFAYRLKQNNIQVTHIDNPVIHQVTETFDEYLLKTRQALKNLHSINIKFGLDEDFVEMNRLLEFYEKISLFYLKIPLLIGFLVVLPFILISFRLSFFNLKIFDFYKLGYYNWLIIKVAIRNLAKISLDKLP